MSVLLFFNDSSHCRVSMWQVNGFPFKSRDMFGLDVKSWKVEHCVKHLLSVLDYFLTKLFIESRRYIIVHYKRNQRPEVLVYNMSCFITKVSQQMSGRI
mmetsp:Transcript_18243/g.61982  ORF Transcript_18243/g.61982 Transcript_18243/m.61982 type:complete len:99 (+) Transcript_18243:2217-2513(+)